MRGIVWALLAGIGLLTAPAYSASDGVGDIFRIVVPDHAPLTLAADQPEAELELGDAACFGAEALRGPSRLYADLMTDRLKTPVELCPSAMSAPGDKLANGEVHFAWLSPNDFNASLAAVTTLIRPSGVGRAPIALVGPKSDTGFDIPALAGQRIALLGRGPTDLHQTLVLEVLASLDLGDVDIVQIDSTDALVAALVDGAVDYAAVDASTIGRHCILMAGEPDPCAGISVLWEDRPQAVGAFATRSDISLALRYRLVGIHIGLHLEAPDLFGWLSGGLGPEFEPAEADALAPLTRGRS